MYSSPVARLVALGCPIASQTASAALPDSALQESWAVTGGNPFLLDALRHTLSSDDLLGVEGDSVRDVGRDLKGFLQDMVKKYEPQVVEQLNQAIGKSLKDGKATIPSA